jgi:hypothetical protein
VTWKPSSDNVGCILGSVTGTLVDVDGRTAIADAQFHGPLAETPLLIRWPDGWQVRRGPGGLEVLDAVGSIQARTGTAVAVVVATGAPGSPGSPFIVDGALLACPFDAIPGR